MFRIAFDVARLEGEPGGMIRKMNECYLDSVEGALLQRYGQDIFDWLVTIDLSLIDKLCEHCAGKRLCDGTYSKDAITVVDVYQGIVASKDSDILL